jgi:hypothetical protein
VQRFERSGVGEFHGHFLSFRIQRNHSKLR